MVPVVSMAFCSLSQTVLIVRRRPHVVSGGGFVVTNYTQRVLFSVDGCGTLGNEGELLVKNGDGEPIISVRKKGGIVQSLSLQNQWRGYAGAGRPVFTLREPKHSLVNCKVKISVEPQQNSDWDFDLKGSFVDRECAIRDRRGNVVAQFKDLYNVVVQPGYDQAFVVGIIAILDNIHRESTRC
ncbi:unnamed protein product [Spirodela intermedia]|nr:unnamed protein product [Spirodela intermedia]CAA6664639.1 unnamed protein product [Spirodela intermedia]